jgi:hypothetical protein
MIFIFVGSCSAYKKVDARKVPQNAQERARKNVSEGKGISVKGLFGNKGGTNYEFSTSNPMWRASLDILDFIPLSNVDYSGGVIITDWYSDSIQEDEALKISLQFLSNEIRSDSIKIKIYKKKCNVNSICQTKETKSKISEELIKSILTQATLFAQNNKTKK